MRHNAKTIANEIVNILKEQGIYTERDSFQQTKMLLNRYSKFKKQIETNEKAITEIHEKGLPPQKKTTLTERIQGGIQDYRGIPEKEQDQIERIEQENTDLSRLVNKTEAALRFIEDEPFYDIVRMKYIENKTIEQIAEQLDMPNRTVYRRMDILIREMRDYIFMNNIIKNL